MMPPAAPGRAEGSRLCLACGLCCQGLLHARARLQDHEAGTAHRLGLPVVATEPGNAAFSLPCPRHQENRCTVYDERPSPCGGYQCGVLQRYLSGDATLAASLAIVQRTQELTASLRRRIGGGAPGRRIWDQLAPLLGDGSDEQVLLETAALLLLCRKHFESDADPGEVLLP
jgi:hypothetical protein